MLKRIVTLLHRWIGLPLGVLFLVTLVTGLVVGGADLLRALDGKGQTYRETSIEEDARALDRMVQDVPRIFQAVLPTPYTPYYQARARGETTRIYRIGDLEPIDHRESFGSLYRLSLGLHRTFLLGRQGGALGISGADAVAWVGLIATVLSLLGIWLWWSYRRSFRWNRLAPPPHMAWKLARDGGKQGLHRSAAVGAGRHGALRRPAFRAAAVQPDRAAAHRPQRFSGVPRRTAALHGARDRHDLLGGLQLRAQAPQGSQPEELAPRSRNTEAEDYRTEMGAPAHGLETAARTPGRAPAPHGAPPDTHREYR